MYSLRQGRRRWPRVAFQRKLSALGIFSTVNYKTMIPTLEWTPEGVRFLDQTRLPLEEVYVLATTYNEVANVITTMVVRGAPAIGVSGAMGVAIGVQKSPATTIAALDADFEVIAKTLASTRPTAVNLFWGIDRMRRHYNALKAEGASLDEIREGLIAEARTHV